jgi:biopolymer transport protein ExbD
MVSSTFVKNTALKVSLPSVKGDLVLEQKKSIDILVQSDNKILINASPVKINELSGKIKKIKKDLNDEDPDLHFKVDKNVSYGFAIKVMGELKSSGIKTIMAVTQKEE